MISPNKKRVCMSLDKEVIAQLDGMAKETGLTKSQLISNMIKRTRIVIDTNSGMRKAGYDYEQ